MTQAQWCPDCDTILIGIDLEDPDHLLDLLEFSARHPHAGALTPSTVLALLRHWRRVGHTRKPPCPDPNPGC